MMNEKESLIQEITEAALGLHALQPKGVSSVDCWDRIPSVLLKEEVFRALFPDCWRGEWHPSGDDDGHDYRVLSFDTVACTFRAVEHREAQS